jgi:hypothetical protein
MTVEDEQALADVDDWFAERGFGILVEREDNEFWVHLTSRRTFEIFHPRYGRGTTRGEAARRARERYRFEQEGVS